MARPRKQQPKLEAAKASETIDGGTSAVMGPLPLWDQHTRLGGGLTPGRVASIIQCADGGDISSLCDLFNECRQKDATIHSNMFIRESAVMSLDWQITSQPGQKRRLTDSQLKRFDSALRETHCVEDARDAMVGALAPGFAVAELVPGMVDGLMVPIKVINHAPRRFRFRQSDGKLVWCDSSTSYREVDFQAQWPDRFIVIQRSINRDVASREGLARLLVWFALFRQWDLGDWLKLAELAWKPYRIGKYKRGASKKDIDILRDVLSNLSTNSAAYFCDELSIDLEWAGGGKVAGQEGHQNLYDAMGREIAKAILSQTLTSDQGGVGSQALGKVHENMFIRVVEADAKAIERCLSEQLIARVCAWNFASKSSPRFSMATDESVELKDFSDAVASLSKAGLRIPAAWVRDELGMPQPVDGEELVKAEAAEPSALPDPSKLQTEEPATDAPK